MVHAILVINWGSIFFMLSVFWGLSLLVDAAGYCFLPYFLFTHIRSVSLESFLSPRCSSYTLLLPYSQRASIIIVIILWSVVSRNEWFALRGRHTKLRKTSIYSHVHTSKLPLFNSNQKINSEINYSCPFRTIGQKYRSYKGFHV